MRLPRFHWALWVLVLAAMVACATVGQGVNTPEKQALALMKFYNAQVDAYEKMILLPNLTDDEKDALRMRRAILVEAWPLIDLYVSYVEAGRTNEVLEMRILDLLDRLVLHIAGRVQ